MKIRTILISQPKPESEKSPYFEIARNYKLNLEFRPFIKVEGMPCNEFRKQRIDLSQYSCIILNSRNAVDNYFRIASEMRYTVPERNKYFCLSEAVALYLQKYIIYRKRKIFFAQQSIEELADLIRKNKDEKFLFPCSDKHTDKITEFLQANRITFAKGVFYRTVSCNMTEVQIKSFDMIVFFSPHGVQSLFDNFPNYVQGEQKIAVFGYTAYQSAISKNLRVDLIAPMPHAPSMTMALEWFVRETNKSGISPAPIVPPAPEPPKVLIPSSKKSAKSKKRVSKKANSPKAKTVKKKATKKSPIVSAKKKTTKKSSKVSAKKPAVKKVIAKSTKTASKVTASKKSAVKKAIAKSTKTVSKVSAAKRPAVKKSIGKSKPTKSIRQTVKKAVAKKIAKKKPVVKKKAAVKKSVAKAPIKKKAAAKAKPVVKKQSAKILAQKKKSSLPSNRKKK